MTDTDSVHDSLMAGLFSELIRQLPPPVAGGNFVTFEVAPDQIRHPDIAICLRPRPRVAGQLFQGAPDLAIEIVSPSDNARDLRLKVRLYLENGATAVWVVWPCDWQIDIHQLGKPTRHLGADNVIEGEEPIPSFRLAVADIFA